MIGYAFRLCQREGIKYIYTSVRKNNISAWRAYNKIGYELVENRKFVRFLGNNIPKQYVP